MNVACHRSQVASHAPLGSEESRMPQSQLVAVQHNEDRTRAGTAPANEYPSTIGDEAWTRPPAANRSTHN